MSPITHFMVGWVALERFQASPRDKALVVCAGLAPDLDGLGIVVDFATRTLGLPETDYYQSFHRMYGHGLPAALLLSALAGMLGVRKMRVAVFAFIAIHLHLLCDLVGSRGAGAEDIWGVFYLAPFTTSFELAWHDQWPLIGWQNMLISATLLAIIMARASVTGYSPLALLSTRADRAFVATLRNWRARLLRTGNSSDG
jgi:inner membrane protein